MFFKKVRASLFIISIVSIPLVSPQAMWSDAEKIYTYAPARQKPPRGSGVYTYDGAPQTTPAHSMRTRESGRSQVISVSPSSPTSVWSGYSDSSTPLSFSSPSSILEKQPLPTQERKVCTASPHPSFPQDKEGASLVSDEAIAGLTKGYQEVLEKLRLQREKIFLLLTQVEDMEKRHAQEVNNELVPPRDSKKGTNRYPATYTFTPTTQRRNDSRGSKSLEISAISSLSASPSPVRLYTSSKQEVRMPRRLEEDLERTPEKHGTENSAYEPSLIDLSNCLFSPDASWNANLTTDVLSPIKLFDISRDFAPSTSSAAQTPEQSSPRLYDPFFGPDEMWHFRNSYEVTPSKQKWREMMRAEGIMEPGSMYEILRLYDLLGLRGARV